MQYFSADASFVVVVGQTNLFAELIKEHCYLSFNLGSSLITVQHFVFFRLETKYYFIRNLPQFSKVSKAQFIAPLVAAPTSVCVLCR